MIVFINTMQCAVGKGPEAKDQISRVVEKFNKDDPETKRYILEPVSGEITEIVLISMHPSFTAYEEWAKKRQEDSEIQALMKEINDSGFLLRRQARVFKVVE